MTRRRIWIEIAMAGTVVACVLAALMALFGVVAGVAVEAVGETGAGQTPTEQIYEGMVTCSRCGAKHSAQLGKTAFECTYTCVRDGASFALVDGETTYTLEVDPRLVRAVVGQRARIDGVANGKTLRVISVAEIH
jgi:hypothetical protein